jgi:hypothetical protein
MMHLRFLSATCAAGFIFLSPTLLAATPSNEGATRELIGDRHFERGCILNEPQLESGRKVEYGTIAGVRPDGKPSWVLAQWHSKEKLSPDPSESLPSGALCYRNAAKAVTFGRTGTADADLTLEVIGSSEYGQRLRKTDEPWVHLLVEQGFENPPALTALSEVRFRVSVRLKNIRRWDEPGYQPGLHAASFPIFISVQNKNRESPGYGQLLWFGVPVYDDRSRMPKSYQALDPGTGMFIYSPGGKEFMGRSAHDRDWVTINTDLLPLMREGLKTAWERGYLKDSQSLADYHIVGMNLGWEVTGIFDVAMQVRDLSLIVTKQTDAKY